LLGVFFVAATKKGCRDEKKLLIKGEPKSDRHDWGGVGGSPEEEGGGGGRFGGADILMRRHQLPKTIREVLEGRGMWCRKGRAGRWSGGGGAVGLGRGGSCTPCWGDSTFKGTFLYHEGHFAPKDLLRGVRKKRKPGLFGGDQGRRGGGVPVEGSLQE